MTLSVLSVNSTDQTTNKLWVWPPVCSRRLSLPFAFLSSPKVAYTTLCSSRDRTALKYCWCPAAKDAGGGGGVLGERLRAWLCVYICATAVMKNNKTDGISFFVVLCSLAHSPLFSVCLSCSRSVFQFGMRFLFLSYTEIRLYIPFEAFGWMIS